MKAKFLPIIFCLFALSAFAQTKEAYKVDEFAHFICDDLYGRFGRLADELKKDSNTTAFIVVYEGKQRDLSAKKERYVLPRFGEAAARTKTMQTRIFTFMNYDPKKFIFIDGGFRERFGVEFWIIPKGAKLPKPTPTIEK
jgi:hypothetical protein